MAKIDTDKLKDMIYGMGIGEDFTFDKVRPENLTEFKNEIRIFIDNDYWLKHGFTLELHDNKFVKVAAEIPPVLTLEEVRQWNEEYYSETRVKLRAK